MPHRISQMIAVKITSANALMGIIQRYASSLAFPAVENLPHPVNGLSGEQLKNFLIAQAALLEEVTRRMRDAEELYLAEQDDDVLLRGRIAEASIELDHKLRLTRDHIRQAEGENALQIYGLSDAPPRARRALVSYARNAIELLSAHPYQFTGSLGQILETRTVAVVLNDLLQPFETLVDRMHDEIDELRSALTRRNDTIDEWIDTYQGIALGLRGLALMTGQRDIAEEIAKKTSDISEFAKL